MKTIKRSLRFLEAKALAERLALTNGRVYSVRMHKTVTPASFYVVEGMVGSEGWCKYTARPATLNCPVSSPQARWGPGKKQEQENGGKSHE